MVLLLSQEDVRSLLKMEETIQAVEEGFRQYALRNVSMPVRQSIALDRYNGVMLTMPAYVGGKIDALGQKVVTVYPDNPKAHHLPTIVATIQLLDPKTGDCLAIMDGTLITAMRTAAASAVATKYLARKDARRVAIFGAGVQARTQLVALSQVRDIVLTKVFDPLPDHKASFCREMSKTLKIDVKPADSPEEATRNSDIIVCASTSKTPVFNAKWLAPGTHINAIGSHTPTAREVDTTTVLSSKLVVDSCEAVLKEAGDIVIPIKEGVITPSHIWAELGEIIVKKKTGRATDEEMTLFKSVGLAVQDISTADVVYRHAIQRNVGIRVDM